MKLVRTVTAILMTSCFVGTVYAFDPGKSDAQKEARVEKELGRLSTDGATAFRDLRLARIAIFNAEPASAKFLIEKTQASLKAATTDDTAYLKADAELNNSHATESSHTKPVSMRNGRPVAWLPIDGQLTLGEDLLSTFEKQTAVQKANQLLHAGDRKSATIALKVAGIDIDFTMAVAPLDETIFSVDQAATLINDKKYYEANALLKQIEDSIRFDTIDLNAG